MFYILAIPVVFVLAIHRRYRCSVCIVTVLVFVSLP